MKFLVFLSFIAFFSLNAQDKLKTITDEKSGKPMLVGIASRSAFQDTSYSWWYNSEYDNYRVKTKDLEGVAAKIKDFNITIVMGTWCSDSHREIPRFFKILDTLNFPENRIKLIMVDRQRKDLSGEVDSLKIELVPTIIFYNMGKEEGRITEAPQETLEKDTYNIVMGKPVENKDSTGKPEDK
ncbi:MAG: thiol reductase thioredoxin [Ignavibacteria bacterium]|jgi:thiol-disulfide isomerase/thioredoxin|nr:thiol reductase thioredoxin [Ignavibacteria bacterium]MCU7502048.1 thiol reductase thioredoxin [Ignavibacteria bacterium]MCU7515450.1 thiol reductase thioredoxin [Ignavibacteria bacterium]